MKTSNYKPFAVQRIKTNDLWQSAFMLAKGSQLYGLQLKKDDLRRKQEFTFILSGNNIKDLKQEFQSRHAVCRVWLLKTCIIHLKNKMSEVIGIHE